LQDAKNLTVQIRVFDINSKEIFTDKWTGNVETNISKFIYKLPEIKGLTSVWFLDLRIFDGNNQEIDNSIYWLSTKPDVLDYEAAKALEWPFHTPSKEYADFTALDKLPKIQLEYDYQYEKGTEDGKVTLKVTNPTSTIAFFTFFFFFYSETDLPILPVYWNDNYITLLPGESRTYDATYNLANSKGEKPVVKVNAWNVAQVTLK